MSILHINIYIYIHIIIYTPYNYIYTSLSKQKFERRPPKKGGLLDTATSKTLMHAGYYIQNTAQTNEAETGQGPAEGNSFLFLPNKSCNSAHNLHHFKK